MRGAASERTQFRALTRRELAPAPHASGLSALGLSLALSWLTRERERNRERGYMFVSCIGLRGVPRACTRRARTQPNCQASGEEVTGMTHPSPYCRLRALGGTRLAQLRALGTVAASGSEGHALGARAEGGDSVRLSR